MFKIIRYDIKSVLERDPAARNVLEVLLCYSGLHAIWAHRLAHKLWQSGFKLLARWISQITRGISHSTEPHETLHFFCGIQFDGELSTTPAIFFRFSK